MEKQSQLALAQFKKSIPLFETLSDESRQLIIITLGEHHQGLSVSQITSSVPLSRPAVSHHLKILKQSGFIDFEKKGKENIYYLTLSESLTELKLLIQLIESSCQKTRSDL